MSQIKRFFVPLVALCLGPFTTVPVQSAPLNGACSSLLAGTYLSNVTDQNGALSSRSILTFHDDGNLSVIDSNQGGAPGRFNQFTDIAGPWSCTGRDTFTARVLDFSLAGTEGPDLFVVRADYTGKIDPQTREININLKLYAFPLTGDPINGVGVFWGEFSVNAQRVALPAN